MEFGGCEVVGAVPQLQSRQVPVGGGGDLILDGAASSAHGKNMSRLSVAAKRKRGARVPEVQCPTLFTR